ncbi:MAG: DUF169 domain-containing protein [Methanomicrobiales archaeon]|nr:DUF169 domain-containing protein [Methanomicrobiales archaeon]
MEDMRMNIPYAQISSTLKEYLGLEGSPVAINLARNREAIPAGMEEIAEQMRHCQMVNLARRNGAIFYATVQKHQCMGGAWAMGLRDITESLKSGEFYYKLGKFSSWAACKRTIEKVPHLGTETFATLYAPLEKTPFSPHVVIIVAPPRAMLKLAQARLFRTGGRIFSTMAGIQSVCADATAQTYLTGEPNFSLGCDGSRRFSGIADHEMVMGLPAELLPEIAEAMKVVVSAPGSI